MDEDKKIEQQILPWRFWFSVTFTCLLIVMFGWYVPMRFQYNALTDVHAHMDAMPDAHDAMMGEEHDGHEDSTYHEVADIKSGLSVDLSYDAWPPEGHPLFGATGTRTHLNFYVNQKPEGTPVPADALEIEHTKLMHVIGIRDDMNEFFHIHPVPAATSGMFTIVHVFEKPGRYKIWSEVKKDGMNDSFGQEPIEVGGVGERFSKSVSFSRTAEVGAYEVNLNIQDPAVKDGETRLFLEIHTKDGKEVNTENYLGAPMHLTLIKDDWKQFIHTHPEGAGHMMYDKKGFRILEVAQAHGEEENIAGSDAADHGIQFRVVFPEAGLYKTFAEFRPQGINLPPDKALTASFWIKVEDKAPGQNPKIVLFLASLGSILLLSWGVKNFLKVNPSP
ncbi:MAG: hypothetical protein HY007_00515 [Candidatus Sungbacteria bacterium]|nr:hypothetical protein [Candidatus Sungbacteria bacterium]